MQSKTKKILFIAPASFPIMGAESIVNVKLLKALSENGFEIDVISKDMKWANYPYQQMDDFGVSLHSLTVIGVENKLNFNTIFLHIMAFFTFGITYKGAHWALLALKKAKQLVQKNNYNYVLTKNAPAELVGYHLKKKYGLKWIATWNDPFPAEKYPEPYGKGVNGKVFIGAKGLINMMQKYPDKHIFPSNRLKNYMLKYLNITNDKIEIIPHVVLASENTSTNPKHTFLKLLHTGNVASPRNPENFLNALHLFYNENPDVHIDTAFMGVLPDNFTDLLVKYNLTEKIKHLPSVEYTKSLEIINTYDVAVIIEAACEEGIFLPTKVSDYMQCKKQIFAISPSIGVLHDLYEEGSIRYFADCNDVYAIKTMLQTIYNDFLTGELFVEIPVKKEFTEKEIVEKYNKF
ncbi:MAG TPA: glycosyltransferase [Bacteroidales bacterium]|nr:glycosyltransferase [Bacteroidales bacterium]HOR81974.1 glycosyltransferase [Bacteroidales bacterium]HPJ91497.1 glycosyltransferase [Bacteroidales bacterium]